jgi:hypothetical protein
MRSKIRKMSERLRIVLRFGLAAMMLALSMPVAATDYFVCDCGSGADAQISVGID